ncbi:hypothetical protein CHELA40_15279 [Chelatococcus asaccharovorans]|nr:hypothetical protein CHELA40_15279 [Chelatococcus asaccharovorans]
MHPFRRSPSLRAEHGMRRSEIYCETVIAIRLASTTPCHQPFTTARNTAGGSLRHAGQPAIQRDAWRARGRSTFRWRRPAARRGARAATAGHHRRGSADERHQPHWADGSALHDECL